MLTKTLRMHDVTMLCSARVVFPNNNDFKTRGTLLYQIITQCYLTTGLIFFGAYVLSSDVAITCFLIINV